MSNTRGVTDVRRGSKGAAVAPTIEDRRSCKGEKELDRPVRYRVDAVLWIRGRWCAKCGDVQRKRTEPETWPGATAAKARERKVIRSRDAGPATEDPIPRACR